MIDGAGTVVEGFATSNRFASERIGRETVS
jgi:hypothetical protein